MNKLFSKISELKKVAGLSLHFVNQNEYKIGYCILQKEKEGLDIADFGEVSNISDLSDNLKDIPVFLNISGKIVIEKVLPSENHSQNAFPNSSEEDFLFQFYSGVSKKITCLVRKDKVNDIIERIEEMNISVISLSLGYSSATYAFSSIENLDPRNFQIFNNQISLDEFEIESIQVSEVSEPTLFVDNQQMNSSEFMSFTAAVNAFYDKDAISVNNHLNVQREDFFHKNIFDKLKIAIPSLFLLLLLVNFLFYSSFLKKNNELSQGDLNNSVIIEKLDKLKSEVKLKQEFLENSNWLSQSKVSYFADQIGFLLPKSIHLKVLDIFPSKLIKKNNSKEYLFDNKSISIEGYSESLYHLNNWKLELQKQDWIKDVELISYLQESKRKDISFELKITLN